MNSYTIVYYGDSLSHHGIKGQRWGRRRWQNEDGSLTEEGKQRYGTVENFERAQRRKKIIAGVAVTAAAVGGAMYLKNRGKASRNLDDISDKVGDLLEKSGDVKVDKDIASKGSKRAKDLFLQGVMEGDKSKVDKAAEIASLQEFKDQFTGKKPRTIDFPDFDNVAPRPKSIGQIAKYKSDVTSSGAMAAKKATSDLAINKAGNITKYANIDTNGKMPTYNAFGKKIDAHLTTKNAINSKPGIATYATLGKNSVPKQVSGTSLLSTGKKNVPPPVSPTHLSTFMPTKMTTVPSKSKPLMGAVFDRHGNMKAPTSYSSNRVGGLLSKYSSKKVKSSGSSGLASIAKMKIGK